MVICTCHNKWIRLETNRKNESLPYLESPPPPPPPPPSLLLNGQLLLNREKVCRCSLVHFLLVTWLKIVMFILFLIFILGPPPPPPPPPPHGKSLKRHRENGRKHVKGILDLTRRNDNLQSNTINIKDKTSTSPPEFQEKKSPLRIIRHN